MFDGQRFTNWDGSISCVPKRYVQPHSEDEVSEIARTGEGPIRVVGAGHSWSPLVLTDGTLLNLDHLNGLVSVDKRNLRATVQAGIRLHDLIEVLDREGLALKNLGAITQQSIAGATGSGTHGTGIKFGGIHTQIAGMRLITHDGSPRVMEDEETLRAARLSLGALGIVTQVEIQCVRAHNMELKAWKTPFKWTMENLDDIVRDNEHARIYWFPGSDDVYLHTMNETDKAPTQRNAVLKWFEDVLLRKWFLGELWSLSEEFPSATHWLDKLEELTGFTPINRVGRSADMLTTPMPPNHIECEYAVHYADAREALERLDATVRKLSLAVNVPSEIRFVQADDAYLSPAYERDVCYIGAYVHGEDEAKNFIPEYEKVIIPMGGRPHWGKRFGLPLKDVAALYPKFEDFKTVRRQFDPEGRFLNHFLSDLFFG